MPRAKMPVPVVLILVVSPIILIGATWFMANSLGPACAITEQDRLPSPDGTLDIVTFARDCGGSESVSEAMIVATGAPVSPDVQGFTAVGGAADLAPRWDAFGNVEVTLPPGGDILWQDETSNGTAIIYLEQ